MMIKNINSLNEKFGINIAVKSLPPKLKDQYLAFRINFLIEELQELQAAHVNKNPEGVVDALIDLIYDNNLTEKGNFNVDYWELILVKLRNINHLQQQIK